MTTVLRRREPLDLPQVDDNSCLTCVAANVLYVFGVTDTPDMRWVDREVGREPGCAAQRPRTRRFLLQQGLSLHVVGAYEPERFLREGVDYLRRYYRQEWASAWDEYWTPDRLDQHRRECLVTQGLSAFGARTRTEHRQPTLADLRDALDRGHVVWISVENGWGEVGCHAVLVYGQRGNMFDVYSPELSGSCLQQYRRRRLDRLWLRNEGMTAMWRRGFAGVATQCLPDVHPGSSPVVVDEHDIGTAAHQRDTAAPVGQVSRWARTPVPAIADLDAHRTRFGPESQLHDAGLGRGVSVLDDVGRCLVDREDERGHAVIGEREGGQPAPQLPT